MLPLLLVAGSVAGLWVLLREVRRLVESVAVQRRLEVASWTEAIGRTARAVGEAALVAPPAVQVDPVVQYEEPELGGAGSFDWTDAVLGDEVSLDGADRAVVLQPGESLVPGLSEWEGPPMPPMGA